MSNSPRKIFKSSPNESTNDLWRATSNHTNIQYDAYNSTKEVLKDFRSGHENKLLNQLTSQGSFFNSVTNFALPELNLTRCGPSPNQSSRKTFTTLPFVILITLFRRAKTKTDGQYLQIQTVLFVLALKHYYT